MFDNLKCKYDKIKSIFRIKHDIEQLTPHIYAASAQVLFQDDVLRFNNVFDKCKYEDSSGHKGEIKFYLPNWRTDFIQGEIFRNLDFFSSLDLKKLRKYIKNDAFILDIGANIGNHSLYWALITKARKIYAFEPIKSTFKILQRNITLNALDNIIIPYNFALGEKYSPKGAKIARYNPSNIGGTWICEDSAIDSVKMGGGR